MEDKNNKTDIIKLFTDSEFVSIIDNEDLDKSEYTKIPYSDLTLLGTGFSALMLLFQEISKSENSAPLYRAFTNGTAGELQYTAKDGSGFIGSYTKSDGKLGQARFQEVSNNTTAYSTSIIFMIAVLIQIEKKLDDIQKTHQEVLNFLQDTKRSELKGNLYFLTDVLNNYKYNLNNKTYKSNMHVKVQDIKQHSEQNIIFYRTQIINLLGKRTIFITDQKVKNNLEKIQSNFEYYQFSLYLYGFSSFLEVMLLENFDKKYLDSIVHKIEDYSYQYRDLYTKCYNLIESNLDASVQSSILDGVSTISDVIGKTVEKIPVISKSQLDENLISAHKDIENVKIEKTEKIMKIFSKRKSSCVYTFTENINTINKLYNQHTDILIDQEAIYLKCSTE